ncbi:hypothetical protein Cgig2_017074 [Carnegiea gigantea]|uniref:Uncharacterized protein n=1 Tax=Carnegiea gigantea TaxID=171969 RepID=A0A9Q1JN71_9CARY|nr:hypothetical protein Cgig2_017074 [Carnegiea gigantea]
MSLDANNGYFPLAYGVVEQEDFQNWVYFFRGLGICLGGLNLFKLTFISDRHKHWGMWCAVGAKLHMLFWASCNAYTKHVYKHTLEAIKKDSKEAYEWLLDEPLKHWARYTFDHELKYANNTTNFEESFNGKIKKYRHKQIFLLLEAIRRKFMQTIANRSRISKDWKGKVVPRVKLLLVKAEKESRACRLTLAGRGIFEVLEGPTHFTIGPPSVEIKRGRPQTERMRDITERRKEFIRSITLKCSLCKQFGHNKRSNRKDGVLQILKDKGRPSYTEKRGKRKVGRPRKEGPLGKKSKTAHQPSSSGGASQPSSLKNQLSLHHQKNQVNLPPQINQLFLLPLKKHLQ